MNFASPGRISASPHRNEEGDSMRAGIHWATPIIRMNAPENSPPRSHAEQNKIFMKQLHNAAMHQFVA